MQDKFKILGLPDAAVDKIASYLNPSDLLYFGVFSQASSMSAETHLAQRKAQRLAELVAFGKQVQADAFVTGQDAQSLLKTPSIFTDYSGRRFNCTPFEYAYWAKDTHMCRMLIGHMDEETKAEMLKRCEAIDQDGLEFEQDGFVVLGSKHFDCGPLTTALQEYVNGFDNWYANNNLNAIKAAWLKVGNAQRDLPAHIANEYCRPDRTFDPLPTFNEPTLPRNLTFFNWETTNDDAWFPLAVSTSSGPGVSFAFYRSDVVAGAGGASAEECAPWGGRRLADHDLAAVSHLDKVRTEELTQLREALKEQAPEYDSESMHISG